MFVPVYDTNPLRLIRFQYVTFTLVVINLAIFALEATGLPAHVVAGFGVVPADLLGGRTAGTAIALPSELLGLPTWATLLSYMFFHGDIWHVATNSCMMPGSVIAWPASGTIRSSPLGHALCRSHAFFIGVTTSYRPWMMTPGTLAIR